MNRDELLAAHGVQDYRPGDKIIEATDGPDVVAHLDISYRRVIVAPPTPRGGNSVTVAGQTLYVAALSNLCFDAENEPGRDWAAELVLAAWEELATHPLIRWACVSAPPESMGRHGFYHPPGHPDPEFLVFDLQDEPWPEGRVEVSAQS